MKAVEGALSSGRGQTSIVWSDLCCYVRGGEVFQVLRWLRGNERGTEGIKVRFKTALSPRDDNVALYSVTKAGCELIPLSLPLPRPLGIHFLFPHSLLGGREANEVADFKKSSLQVGSPFPRWASWAPC